MVDLIDDHSFMWLGRIDHVINSGGIKINPETIEPEIGLKLKEVGFKGRYFVVGMSDPELSEKAVLLVEGFLEDKVKKKIHIDLKTRLPEYHSPKETLCLDKFIETDNGKIKRQETLKYYLSK
jgi:O-succinylbenzoic acid--CoA ligase